MNEWISVKDKMPKEGAYCVVLMRNLVYKNRTMAVDRMEEEAFFLHGCDPELVITHWLPLPEPPKEDGEEI